MNITGSIVLRFFLILLLAFTFVNSVHAAECKDDPIACTPKELCSKATETISGVRYWISDESNKYLKITKKYGLDCKAEEAASACQKDANECSIVELCNIATESVGGSVNWSLSQPEHTKLAKSFGMDCGVSVSDEESTERVVTPCDRKPAACITDTLCQKATHVIDGTLQWRADAKAYVEEAKKRQISCSINQDVQNTQPIESAAEKPAKKLMACDRKPAACITEALCERATTEVDGKIVWREQEAPAHVAEAKKRKLSCTLPKALHQKTEKKSEALVEPKPQKLQAVNVAKNAQFNKGDFQALDFNQRRQLQYGLQKLGYYKSAIDGLYGPMTQAAVRSFADDSQIKDGYPLSVISELRKEVVNLDDYKITKTGSQASSLTRGGDFSVFPFLEIGCRAVFAKGNPAGFIDVENIKNHLKRKRCTNLDYDVHEFSLADAVSTGVKIDFDNDGIKDQLVFLYGFQKGNPLNVIAFKMNKNYPDYLHGKNLARFSPLVKVMDPKKIFASGKYPKIVNARFTSVVDFNNDGKDDVFIAEGGYEWRPDKNYPSKIFLSSPQGYEVIDVTEPRRTHGGVAGDINGDGYPDIILGWGDYIGGKTDSSRLLLNKDGKTFLKDNNRLPKLLRDRNRAQPPTIDLLDIDLDGHLDLISGQSCGNYSKVYWNDGKGYFREKNSTVIPLYYPEKSQRANNGLLQHPNCKNKRTTLIKVYLATEERTGKRYLGAITNGSEYGRKSGRNTIDTWSGRHLTLHEIEGRSLSKDIQPVKNMDIIKSKYKEHFAYKIDYKNYRNGHVVQIFDYQFYKVTLKFDPVNESYSRIALDTSLNSRWLYDVEKVIR